MLAALCAGLSGCVAIRADPVGAAPLSDCTADRGAIVAVDFAHWGGPIVRGCGIKQPSGYALLRAAGFTTAGDEYDGPAFICRIGNQAFHDGSMYPTPSEDPCIQTPPASAYWSYWLAPAGQNRWTYSPLGPTGDVPAPGEVELWIFGATSIGASSGSGVPSFSPSRLRAANATATTRTSTTTAPRVVSARPTRVRTSSGSAVPLVVGICLVLALAAGAARAARRRRDE